MKHLINIVCLFFISGFFNLYGQQISGPSESHVGAIETYSFLYGSTNYTSFNWDTPGGTIISTNTFGDTIQVRWDDTSNTNVFLEADDGNGNDFIDTLLVTVTLLIEPVANAGIDDSIMIPTNSITLDGSQSTDSDGTIVSYQWVKTSGGTAVFNNSNIVNPQLTSLEVGTYVFELTVTDNDGLTDTDTVIITVSSGSCDVSQSERDALMAFYNATNGDGWYDNTGWGTTAQVCDWFGIWVNDDTGEYSGTVNGIDLRANNLVGTVPSSILENLPNLFQLDLGYNTIDGPIPTDIGVLIFLDYLFLDNNEFDGTIPLGLGNLINLQALTLGDNELIGSIPQSISLIPTLTQFRFDNNAFVFSDFEEEHTAYNTNLTTYTYSPQAKVDLEETINATENTSYTFTTSLSSTNNSYQWYKDGVAITGAISKDYTINSMASTDAGVYYVVATNSIVTGLTLQRHNITVNITTSTDCVSASERAALIALYNATNGDNWTNTQSINQPWLINDSNSSVCDWYGVTVENGHVTKLILESNKLSGNISPELQYLTSLKELNLDRNNLDGSIPSELRYLTNLKVLSLFLNQLTGSIPPELGELTNLKHLDLNGRVAVGIESGVIIVEGLLTGSIPTELENLTNLEFLGLYGNRFSEEIPPALASIPTLDTLYVAHNKFVFNDFENEHTSYTNNLATYWYSPQAKVDQEETISVPIGSDSPQLSTSLSGQYNTYQWQFSSDGGNTYTDIVGATGHDYIISNATVEDQGLYRLIANNTIVTGLTLERYPITVLVGSSISFCTYGLEDPTIADLLPNGSNIEWYTSETGGYPLSSSGDIVTDAVNIEGVNYWWDDITDSITTRTVSTVYVDNKTPEGDTVQLFNIYASLAPSILDIEVFNSDKPVYWYASDSSTTPLDTSTLLVSGETYYASSCDAADDTCSCRLPITVTLGILPPKGDEIQFLCESSIINDIALELDSGMSVVWYEFVLIGISSNGTTSTTSTTLTNPLNESTLLTDGKTYFAVQKYSNGVESKNYLKVVVYLSSTPAPVVLETTQTFYANESQTIGDLLAFGEEISWYDSETGGNLYSEGTALIDGDIYYAEQISGDCSSTNRVPVTVNLLIEVAEPLLGCELFRPELLEHYVIDAWVNEREVTTETISEIPFNDSEESELFVGLLNHLKNRLLSNANNKKDLRDFPTEYEPEFTGGESELDFAPLMAYIEGLGVSEKKFVVYDFKAINDNYGRAIGFSFYLNSSKDKQFMYETPTFTYTYKVLNTTNTGVTQVEKTEHYPLLNNIGNTTDEFLNFTKVEVDVSGQFKIHSDFNQADTDVGIEISEIGELTATGVIKQNATSYKYTEVDYQATPTYTEAKIEISFVDADGNAIDNTLITLSPTGEIIDKWQKITGDFTIPNNAGRMSISLKNNNTSKIVYFDDLRIQPFDSNMKTFVYHPENQRLMSELDENNYATFYEYDAEGGLIRVKKETVKGVYTIQETRSGNIKATN